MSEIEYMTDNKPTETKREYRPRMRTIDQAAEYVKSTDPGTALTKTALRRLVTTGVLPSVRIGQKYLLSLEALEAYLSDGMQRPTTAPHTPGIIRQVDP